MAKSSGPPKWVNSLLNKFLDAHLSDAIIGDLSEAFFDDLEHHGYKRARRRYIAGALGFFRYYRFKKKRPSYQSRLNALDMFFETQGLFFIEHSRPFHRHCLLPGHPEICSVRKEL